MPAILFIHMEVYMVGFYLVPVHLLHSIVFHTLKSLAALILLPWPVCGCGQEGLDSR